MNNNNNNTFGVVPNIHMLLMPKWGHAASLSQYVFKFQLYQGWSDIYFIRFPFPAENGTWCQRAADTCFYILCSPVMADRAKCSKLWVHFTKFNENAAKCNICLKHITPATSWNTNTTFDKSEAMQHVWLL